MGRSYKLKTHYPMVDLGMVVSLLIAFCAIVGTVSIESNIWQAKIDAAQISLENKCSMRIENIGFSELVSCMETVGDIVRAEDVNLMFNAVSTSCLTDIFLHGDLSVWYPLLEGRYPDEELKTHVPVALVGKDRAEMLYEHDGKTYISVESEEYLVTGIVGMTDSNLLSHTLLLFADALGENVSGNLDALYRYEIYAESRQSTAQELYKQVWNSLNENGYAPDIEVQETYLHNYEKNRREDEIPSVLLFAFCMVEAVLVSEVWIYERMPELVIRKTFGYTDIRLALYLAGEIAKYLLLTAVLAFAGLIVLNLCGLLSVHLSLMFVVMMFGTALVIGGIVICYPLYYVSHLSEWQLMKKIG